MKQTIRIIRHAKLAKPFSDYNNLSFEQFRNLSVGQTNPPLDDTSLETIPSLCKNNLHDVEAIICSSLDRARKTARAFKLALKYRGRVKTSKNLSEVYFDPYVFSNSSYFSKNKLPGMRKQIFESMISGNGSESVKVLFKRAEIFHKKLKKMDESKILCITHGFFLRILFMYFVNGARDYGKVTYKDLTKAPNYGNLQGFQIII